MNPGLRSSAAADGSAVAVEVEPATAAAESPAMLVRRNSRRRQSTPLCLVHIRFTSSPLIRPGVARLPGPPHGLVAMSNASRTNKPRRPAAALTQLGQNRPPRPLWYERAAARSNGFCQLGNRAEGLPERADRWAALPEKPTGTRWRSTGAAGAPRPIRRKSYRVPGVCAVGCSRGLQLA